MDIEYVRQRITELRLKRNISEYQLSYDIGHSKNYVHNIVTGYSQPSVKELLYLIEVLGVSPRDFFDEESEFRNPQLAKQIIDGIKELSDEDLIAVLLMIQRLIDK
ncbi:XRE family transcriptional regulator [Colidextribacter sp. OB.20]|uniref:helix-turn-helix domain-containing protein n=1 Tax=Colidextribacter sp. OB.20 TaxID=2304568 RepID=UPI00136D9415|nr:helix-turn-helix transcriptional regulator [Colidextribacter sp. OB.20]NBI11522.1 XRE family transcriptional regulator [Colidextribacter sp. OB.20]